ncbi:MAG TPA: GntR family transcriptional regulator [Clostridia bacterium]|nr:GntR family transcriptional regulator [Clostridia bacterium]
MLSIDRRSRVPIYEQIKNEIIEMIRIGKFETNEQLPSIRKLARDTGLNVNTVKHAFSDLESDGVIYSLPGRGSFVSPNGIYNKKIQKKAVDELRASVTNALMKGVAREACIEVIEKIYKTREEDNG